MVWGVGCRVQDLGFRVSFFGRNMSLPSGCKMLVLRFVRPTYGVFLRERKLNDTVEGRRRPAIQAGRDAQG